METTTKPCMLLNVDDYLAETAQLSLKERGAIFLLMSAAWLHEGHLQDDDVRLQIISHLNKHDWKKSKARLRAFFYVSEQGTLRNLHVDRALHHAQMRAMTN
jgi:uncharacterized protein YdaU (DUF1376 family)